MYRKLKRVWGFDSCSYIPKFAETFPELNHLDYEELCRRWRSLGVDFYTEKEVEIKWWIRLTLPFALITLILMLAWTPFKFIFTGEWGYSLSENNRILNWFKALRL